MLYVHYCEGMRSPGIGVIDSFEASAFNPWAIFPDLRLLLIE